MTTEMTQTSPTGQGLPPIGARLQTAREALGMERKDAAAQLRLNEKVITMLEKGLYPDDLPKIFVRGYIRSYGKFLQLSDLEISEAVAPIKPEPVKEETQPAMKQLAPLTSGNYLMRLVTYAIAFTLLGLVTIWWYNHNSAPHLKAEKVLPLPFDVGIPQATLESAGTPVSVAPVNTGNPVSGDAIKIPLAPQVKNAITNSATSSQPVASTLPPATKIATGKPAYVNHSNKRANDDDDEYNDVE